MTTLASGLSWIDLQFLGRPHAIATAVLRGADGAALIDPGPTTCLPTLRQALQDRGTALSEVTEILLTHIHLDHAGATGTIVRAHPHIRVTVHERGAAHLVSPGKLLESAARLYGADMDRLWGEVAPVPEQNLSIVKGGERRRILGREIDVAWTPGHASHHVSYFDTASRIAFVGDTAGVCIDGGYVLPPTPPPDIDVERWEESLVLIDAWSPDTLFLTHFGPIASGVRAHLRVVRDNLRSMATVVLRTLGEDGTDRDRSRRFAEWLRRDLRTRLTDVQLESYCVAAPFELLWLGLARYWRKKDVALS